MNRRGFLKMLGAGAAVTAAGLLVPDVARKIFLPPRGGWLTPLSAFNVGDVVTFEGIHDPLVIRRCKQFVVTSITPSDIYRYDAAWTLPNGEEEQVSVRFDDPFPRELDLDLKHTDRVAREILEGKMRQRGAFPGSKHFKLELPRNVEARYI
jgi:hypothetical protein